MSSLFWQDGISPGDGPHHVLVKRGEFVDSARDGRKVPYKIYHPAGDDLSKRPVIIWSHGFGGSRDGASFLARYVASYGYTLVHITHDGSDSSLWEGKPGHPWDILREIKISREATLLRFGDVPFVLDQLTAFVQENPDAGAVMDLENIGMSGHSFGAMTTQAMAGMMFPDRDQKLISFRERRFKAGILYSPVPIRHLIGPEITDAQVYGPIAIPLLHMTGTQDDSPLEGFGYKHRLSVFENTGCFEKYALIKDEGDHMVYNGTRGKLEINPRRAVHEGLVQVISLAFWEAHLTDNKKARDWLVGEGVQAYIAGEAAFIKGNT